MKALLLDPGLLNRHGHHFHTDHALFLEFQRRGFEVEVFGNRDVEPEIRTEIAVRPVFRATAYPSRDGASDREHAEDLISFNRLVEEDLRQTKIDVESKDLIVVPTARDIHLSGMWHWYHSLAEPRPIIALRVLFAPWFRVREDERESAIATSVKQLEAWVALPRTVLIAESEPLASYFSNLIGKPLQSLPMPLTCSSHQNGIRPVNRRPVRLLFLGEARREKGFHLLADTLARVLRSYPNISLTAQTSCLFDVDHTDIDRLRSLPIGVETVDQPLSHNDYQSLLQASDLVLVPYDPDAYRLRTSSIFLEAVCGGKPVLTTADTWMEQESRRLGLIDIVVSEFTSAGIASAMENLLARWAEAVRLARAAAPVARAKHSAAAFLDALTPLVEKIR